MIDKRCPKNIECNINSHTVALSKQKKSQVTFTPNRNIEQLDINNIKLKDYSGKLKSIDVDATSPYIELLRYDGSRSIIKKMSLCWLLRQDCQKLSSDRLLRVRHTTRKQRLQNDRNLKQKLKKSKAEERHNKKPLRSRKPMRLKKR